jgi:hypothetical protein
MYNIPYLYWCLRHLFVSFVKYLLFKSMSRKYALNLLLRIHSSLSIILQLSSLISCYHLISIWVPTYHLCSGSPFCFILSTLRLVRTPTYSSVSLSVTHQARYRFSDSPNLSGVDFIPHATSFSVQMDSPFLPKLTSRLHFFIFFPLHHHPRRKHPNPSSPSDSSVPNIGCHGPSILFNLPFRASLGNCGGSVPFVVSVLWVPSALCGARPVITGHSVSFLSLCLDCTS